MEDDVGEGGGCNNDRLTWEGEEGTRWCGRRGNDATMEAWQIYGGCVGGGGGRNNGGLAWICVDMRRERRVLGIRGGETVVEAT
jgi:hypothetical protein